jgi:hypothetical protein
MVALWRPPLLGAKVTSKAQLFPTPSGLGHLLFTENCLLLLVNPLSVSGIEPVFVSFTGFVLEAAGL